MWKESWGENKVPCVNHGFLREVPWEWKGEKIIDTSHPSINLPAGRTTTGSWGMTRYQSDISKIKHNTFHPSNISVTIITFASYHY